MGLVLFGQTLAEIASSGSHPVAISKSMPKHRRSGNIVKVDTANDVWTAGDITQSRTWVAAFKARL